MVRRPGLWVEIGLNLALLTVAVSVLDAAVFFIVTQGVMIQSATSLGEESAAVVAAQLAAGPEASWPRTVEAHRRGGLRLTLYAPSGEVLAGDPVPASADVRAVFVTRDLATTEDGGVVQIFAPVGAPGRPLAALALRVPVTATSSPAWVVVGAHAIFSAAIMVIFGLVLFRRSLVVPLGQLRDGTRRIAAGEFGIALSEDAPGEIAELGASLNAMSAALAGYRDRTADQLARLEAANAEIRRTQDALVRSEKLASVGRLAAGLAHELGNPLAAVRGFLEVLALESAEGGSGEVGARDAEILRRCGMEAERMHLLLRNLLDFARREEPREVEIDAVELLKEAAATVRHQASFRGVRVDTDALPGVALRGEPAKLHQALVNLLLNAADAGARAIRLSAVLSEDEVVLACEDDGRGILPEHLPRLFEPFFTTRPPGQGTGLGLAITHRIIEQHGGRIEVRSEPGSGATFTLRLPRGLASSVGAGADPAEPAA